MRPGSFARRLLSAAFPALLCALLPASATAAPAVLPAPREFEARPDSLALGAGAAIWLHPGLGPEDRAAIEEWNRWAVELGLPRALPLRTVAGDSQSPAAMGLHLLPLEAGKIPPLLAALGVRSAAGLGTEGYLLAVGKTYAAVAAPTARGRFYGLMTLAQLLERQHDGAVLPGCVVRDWPGLSFRGISDDISRGQVSTLADFQHLVRLLARHKLNVYMPYLEDIVRLEGLPGFGEGRGALTRQEITALVRFADSLHVRVIPIFQTLGHYENLLHQSAYRHLAEFPGAHTLSPAGEATYRFLDQALGELIPAFPDSLLNIACDESWDLGKGSSRPLVARLGSAGAHAGHYRKVYDLVTARGKQVMMYGDIILNHPAILQQLPRGIVIVDWHYNAAKEYPSVARFRAAGFPVVVSPGLSNWNRIHPDWDTALDNIENLTRVGARQGALGTVTSSWCDNGAANFRQLNLWGYAFAAACAWRPEATVDRAAAERAFWRSFLALEDPAPMIELNRLLVTLGKGFTLYDFWRQPQAGPAESGGAGQSVGPAARATTILAALDRADRLLATVRAASQANRDWLELPAYALAAGRLLGGKYRWVADHQALAGKTPSAAQAAKLAENAGRLERGYRENRAAFERLWTAFNRPAGLEYNLALFDRQLAAWDELESSLRERGKLPLGLLSADWIAPAGASAKGRRPGRRTALYRGEFDLSATEAALPAKLQLAGMTHAEVWVNGRPVGETLGRRSLSLIVESRRFLVVDLNGLLKPGKNLVTARVRNYEGRAPALSIYAEFEGPGGSGHPHPRVRRRGPRLARAGDFRRARGLAGGKLPRRWLEQPRARRCRPAHRQALSFAGPSQPLRALRLGSPPSIQHGAIGSRHPRRARSFTKDFFLVCLRVLRGCLPVRGCRPGPPRPFLLTRAQAVGYKYPSHPATGPTVLTAVSSPCEGS